MLANSHDISTKDEKISIVLKKKTIVQELKHSFIEALADLNNASSNCLLSTVWHESDTLKFKKQQYTKSYNKIGF